LLNESRMVQSASGDPPAILRPTSWCIPAPGDPIWNAAEWKQFFITLSVRAPLMETVSHESFQVTMKRKVTRHF